MPAERALVEWGDDDLLKLASYFRQGPRFFAPGEKALCGAQGKRGQLRITQRDDGVCQLLCVNGRVNFLAPYLRKSDQNGS